MIFPCSEDIPIISKSDHKTKISTHHIFPPLVDLYSDFCISGIPNTYPFIFPFHPIFPAFLNILYTNSTQHHLGHFDIHITYIYISLKSLHVFLKYIYAIISLNILFYFFPLYSKFHHSQLCNSYNYSLIYIYTYTYIFHDVPVLNDRAPRCTTAAAAHQRRPDPGWDEPQRQPSHRWWRVGTWWRPPGRALFLSPCYEQ